MGPKALPVEELIDIFKNRGMDVTNLDIDKLRHINYYKLKEFAHPLCKIKKIDGERIIDYSGVSFNEVLRRYYQDKNLRIYLLHAIEKIEVSIKTNLAHELGLKYGAFGYLDFSQWCHRSKYSRFKIEDKQFSFKKGLLKSVAKQRSAEYNLRTNKDADGFPTIWLAIDAMTFGDITTILDCMNDGLLRKIASKYEATSEEFLSWVRCLQFIRNICAHNSNLIDVKLITKPKLRKNWMQHLYFITAKDGISKTPTDRLAAVICIVVYLVNLINPKYKLKNIQNSIKSICHDSDDRANLLGFNSLSDAISIATITETKNS